MDFGDEVGLGQVQRVEAAVDEDALRVQHRPHRAVADEDTPFDRFEKGFMRDQLRARPAPSPSSRLRVGAGTSRSALSQMKSFVL